MTLHEPRSFAHAAGLTELLFGRGAALGTRQLLADRAEEDPERHVERGHEDGRAPATDHDHGRGARFRD